MLPRDLWTLKAIQCGGMDTSIYKDTIAHYWGVMPFEQYGSTEGGVMATQTWNKKGMTFFPDAAFFEFVPESEWARWNQDPSYVPPTLLMNEVKPGERYEVVVTNFFGNPLLRYRMHDVIEFTSLRDEETDVDLPQMVFVGRSGDLIDLAGFTGIIDEKMVWQAIVNTQIPYEEWAIRKESLDDQPGLHLYIEPSEPVDEETLCAQVHEKLKELNPYYADYEQMIEKRPLVVTMFSRGTFGAFMAEMQAEGADLAHLKPPHMNASNGEIERLMRLCEEIARQASR